MSKRQRRWIKITRDFREAVAKMLKESPPADAYAALAMSNALINAYWMEHNARCTDRNLEREQQRAYFETE